MGLEAKQNVLVIFGAAVWPDGRPSNAMLRRVRISIETGRGLAGRLFIPSGAVGRYGPAEAEVIRDLLRKGGVPDDEIYVEDQATDTLQTVLIIAKLIEGFCTKPVVWICTDTYHVRRCIWLFRLIGIKAKAGKIENGRPETKPWKWLRFVAREYPALVWDTAILVFSRKRDGLDRS